MKIVVIGASGYVGTATVSQLVAQSSSNEVIAVIRDPSKQAAKDLVSKGATVVAGDMADPTSLDSTLSGADAVYIVVPGHIDRTNLGNNALEACKRAKVGFVLMLSVATAEMKGQIFADQFKPLEEATIASGLNYGIVRLPMFLDNIGAQLKGLFEGGNQFYTPIESLKQGNSVSVADVGEASAKILLNPAVHTGKTYNLCGNASTEADMAAALSKALGKTIEHVQVPYEGAKQAFMGMGFPEWQTDGVIELMKNVNEEAPSIKIDGKDTASILGRAPLTPEAVAAYLTGK
jgi:NAD(P)H dehydrogenase (quinone)